MTTDDGYLYRADLDALVAWMLAQWHAWALGDEGPTLALAAAVAPPGPEGDAARAAWSAAVEVRHAAISAALGAKRVALIVRPGERDEPSVTGRE